MTFFVFPILQKMWKSRFRVFILIPSRDQKPKKKASAEQKKDKPKSKKKASVKQKKKKQSQSRKSVWSRRKERGSRSRRSLQRRRLWEGRQNKERSKDDVLLDWFVVMIQLKIFIHIFEGNPDSKNEYPVENFWSMGKTRKVMYLPLIIQML